MGCNVGVDLGHGVISNLSYHGSNSGVVTFFYLPFYKRERFIPSFNPNQLHWGCYGREMVFGVARID